MMRRRGRRQRWPVAPSLQILAALVRGLSPRNFQHAGGGRNPDENWHGAFLPCADRLAGLPSFDHQHKQGHEPLYSTEG